MNELRRTLKEIVENHIEHNFEAAKDEGFYLDNILGKAQHKTDLRAQVNPDAPAPRYANLPAANLKGYANLDYARLTPHQKQGELVELSKSRISNHYAGMCMLAGAAATALLTVFLTYLSFATKECQPDRQVYTEQKQYNSTSKNLAVAAGIAGITTVACTGLATYLLKKK